MKNRIFDINKQLISLINEMNDSEAQIFLDAFYFIISNSNLEEFFQILQQSLCEMCDFDLKLLLLIYYFDLNARDAINIIRPSNSLKLTPLADYLNELQEKYISKAEACCKKIGFQLPKNID